MATIEVDDIADLINSTNEHQIRKKWTDLTGDVQEYIAMPQLLKTKSVKVRGGKGVEWKVVTGTSGNARNVGLYSVDSTVVTDVISTASIPWRQTESSWAWDKHEFLVNSGKDELIDLIKLRRTDGWIDLAKLIENDFWTKPPDSSDKLMVYGVDYWNVFDNTGVNAAAGAGGFTQDLPSGFTTVAGIDPAVVTRWGNWSHQYVDITKDDLISKMRKGARFTKFKAPIAIPELSRGRSSREYFTNNNVMATLERSLELQNDNLGNDIASKDGMVTFLRNPVHWVPQLEDNSSQTDPVIQIDWSKFVVYFLKGSQLVESKAAAVANSHNVIRQHVDLTWNIACTDRRSMAYYAK